VERGPDRSKLIDIRRGDLFVVRAKARNAQIALRDAHVNDNALVAPASYSWIEIDVGKVTPLGLLQQHLAGGAIYY
jgi:hypothetical protein